MARKRKYPHRPWNDGDRWIDGVRHSKPRQNRGQPIQNVTHTPIHSVKQVNTGVDHTTKWKPLSKATVIEMCLKGTLTVAQVEEAIAKTFDYRAEFREMFIEALQEGAAQGTVDNAPALFVQYRSCMVGW